MIGPLFIYVILKVFALHVVVIAMVVLIIHECIEGNYMKIIIALIIVEKFNSMFHL